MRKTLSLEHVSFQNLSFLLHTSEIHYIILNISNIIFYKILYLINKLNNTRHLLKIYI